MTGTRPRSTVIRPLVSLGYSGDILQGSLGRRADFQGFANGLMPFPNHTLNTMLSSRRE